MILTQQMVSERSVSTSPCSGFYVKPETSSPQAVPAAGELTISMTALLELLKNADPEVKAQLRLALLT